MFKKIFLTAALVSVFAFLLAAGGGFYLFHKYKTISVSARMFNGLKDGSAEAEVKKTLPSGAAMSAKDVYAKGDSNRADLPVGDECRHYLARDQRTAGTGAGVKVYRVCFRDGKLAQKKVVLSTS